MSAGNLGFGRWSKVYNYDVLIFGFTIIVSKVNSKFHNINAHFAVEN